MGKTLHFKSKAAYQRWLAHGHISGKFKETPGHQKIVIRGKPHKVKHD
jgi:hypothetical protein